MGRKPEGKTEKAFKKFGKQIDEMIVDLKNLKNKAKDEYSDQVDELKRNGETLKEEFGKLNEKDKWDEVGDRLESAGKEVKEAFKRAFSSKK